MYTGMGQMRFPTFQPIFRPGRTVAERPGAPAPAFTLTPGRTTAQRAPSRRPAWWDLRGLGQDIIEREAQLQPPQFWQSWRHTPWLYSPFGQAPGAEHVGKPYSWEWQQVGPYKYQRIKKQYILPYMQALADFVVTDEYFRSAPKVPGESILLIEAVKGTEGTRLVDRIAQLVEAGNAVVFDDIHDETLVGVLGPGQLPLLGAPDWEGEIMVLYEPRDGWTLPKAPTPTPKIPWPTKKPRAITPGAPVAAVGATVVALAVAGGILWYVMRK